MSSWVLNLTLINLKRKYGSFFFLLSFLLQENKSGDCMWAVAGGGNVDALILQVNLQKTYLESCLLKPTLLPLG